MRSVAERDVRRRLPEDVEGSARQALDDAGAQQTTSLPQKRYLHAKAARPAEEE
ncbi:MAG TPA: hypothetical protein VFI65_02060 [Streptosporangiaceae bacterium]|nr:hypothetical protein [Streptosporangiaceae bacterium]